jgi:hypothetical protein
VEFGEAAASYVVGLCWLGLHFLLYVAILRNRSTFQTERGIFLYHFISAILVTGAAGVLCLVFLNEDAFAVALGLIAAHGIYSVSFLELWSLSQGSYSLSIMTGAGTELSRAKLIETFMRVGNEKKSGRIANLAKSPLIRSDGHYWNLTGSGRAAAMPLRALLWLANIKDRG